jgi:hypothetical protein
MKQRSRYFSVAASFTFYKAALANAVAANINAESIRLVLIKIISRLCNRASSSAFAVSFLIKVR